MPAVMPAEVQIRPSRRKIAGPPRPARTPRCRSRSRARCRGGARGASARGGSRRRQVAVDRAARDHHHVRRCEARHPAKRPGAMQRQPVPRPDVTVERRDQVCSVGAVTGDLVGVSEHGPRPPEVEQLAPLAELDSSARVQEAPTRAASPMGLALSRCGLACPPHGAARCSSLGRRPDVVTLVGIT